MNTSRDLEIVPPRAADLHPLPAVGLCPRFSSAALLPVRLARWMRERQARLDAVRRTRRENELAKIRRQKLDFQNQKSLTTDNVSFLLETPFSVMQAEYCREIFNDNFRPDYAETQRRLNQLLHSAFQFF